MRTLLVPFQIDQRGGLAYTEDTYTIVAQQIIDIVATQAHERVMFPQHGADLRAFLFSPIVSSALKLKAQEVKALLSGIVTLAQIVSVNLTVIPDSYSALRLDIGFTILPSTEIFFITHTIDGLVTQETQF